MHHYEDHKQSFWQITNHLAYNQMLLIYQLAKFQQNYLLNVLKFLIHSQIFFLQNLSMTTLISEMPYFRIIALLFMTVKFYHYLAIVWRTSVQHGELLCVESGGFHG